MIRLAAALTLACSPAFGQAACFSRDVLVKVLTDKHQEAQQSAGLMRSDTVLEVFVSPSGSWSVLITTANGVSCVAATGKHWHQIEGAVPVKPNL